jgi:phosphatidylserine/phosphatidylglycerophosphate/cardiolipin synthase-like enzyme
MSATLILHIRLFVVHAPQELVERVAYVCENFDDWAKVISNLNGGMYSVSLNKQLSSMIEAAKELKYPPRQLALALRAAKDVAEAYRTQQSLEMVWTGPEIAPFSLRRTDEALLQMISNAEHSLTIVSFAFFKIDRVLEALKLSLLRGVDVQFFLETDPDKIAGGGELLRRSLPPAIKVYSWSPEYRLRNKQGQYGALHAKIAIADNSSLLVSSANFTENAMSLNIELGLMVTGGTLPTRASQLLSNLLIKGVFVESR